MQQFAAHHQQFVQNQLQVVRVFHSPVNALQWVWEQEPPPFPILADPERIAYGLFGVEKTLRSLLKFSAHRRVKESREARLKPRWRDAIRDGFTGLPADFLVGPEQTVLRAHYGKDFTDSLTVEDALDWIRT